jgi:rhodanese-related sulfurtransferase
MNDSGEPAATVRHDSASITWSQVIAILAAAVALGVVYNIASPLGVRPPKPENQVAIPSVKSNTPVPPLISSVPTNSASLTSTSGRSTSNSSVFSVHWAEIKPLVEAGQIVLVDGRPKTAYDVEHIPNAVSLPLESAPQAFIDFATKYPQNTAIVVYCSSENCDAAHELADKLRRELGYTNVKEMPGGVVEYRMAESHTNQPSLK